MNNPTQKDFENHVSMHDDTEKADLIHTLHIDKYPYEEIYARVD